ncbi:membrane protein DedA with SNARE-associated domain [Actinoalloteichus hoggarensis]|uniref:Inner membrane protein YohD n=1 Tax=Actinoalloteichus hoggarensis TaxID=1470176 RepID=A0A221W7M3_9PSEU|nr:DedA family protein [Actinoalloteichus hoggarensis]ASO21377.1 Inner membrane protein YohD [Actinoalloteichus hoggarensis]MBB5921310.1 membrane protein DedA with SNARE-associated domain [Actinoalloteichus hoggarensis]
MALLTDALNALAELPQPAVIAATGLLVLAETTIGLGFIAPGETGLLIAATTVRDPWAFAIMCLVVTVCASMGDSIGFYLGRRFGPRIRETKLIRKIGQSHWDRAGDLLRKHGIWAVFFARFLPVVRTLTPAAAGASGLAYRRFLPTSIVGAACWSVLHVGIGAGAGAGAQYIEARLGQASWILLIAIAVLTILVILLKTRKARRVDTPAAPGDARPTDVTTEDAAGGPQPSDAARSGADSPASVLTPQGRPDAQDADEQAPPGPVS